MPQEYGDLAGFGRIVLFPGFVRRIHFGNDRILFPVEGSSGLKQGSLLWKMNGTDEGTRMVHKFEQGALCDLLVLNKNNDTGRSKDFLILRNSDRGGGSVNSFWAD